MKTLHLLFIIAIISVLTSCSTVQGAFQGAGHDTRAAAHALQID